MNSKQKKIAKTPGDSLGILVKKPIERRRFLRGIINGVQVAVALPLLDCFLNDSGNALAQGGTIPKRFGTFFWGLGFGPSNINYWIPNGAGSGNNWSISPSGHGLSPLAPYKDYLTVFSNYSHPLALGAGHIPQRGIAVSASHNPDWVANSGADGFRKQNMPLPSIDSLIQSQWGELGTVHPFLNTTLGVGSLYVGTSSWNAGGGARLFHNTPLDVYNSIFKDAGGGNDQPELKTALYNFRKSVLDGTLEEMNSFSKTLGAKDLQRLEAHTDQIRAYERQLKILYENQDPLTGQCSTVPVPNNFAAAADLSRRSAVMSDLLVMALSCNLTRIFCFEFSPTQVGGTIPEIGLTSNQGVHDGYSHTDAPKMREYLSYVMQNLSVLVGKLANVKEGDSNLLDNMLMVATSEYAAPHNHVGHPYLFIGKAGGGVKGNYHSKMQSTNNSDASRILLTAAHGIGVKLPQIGMPETAVGGAKEGEKLNPPKTTKSYVATTPITEVLT